jgi:sugar transferase (PEP-CTERM/EpsH1 system associated)
MSASPANDAPLVLHVLFNFAVGGLENGVVNLINRMAESNWRHGIIALSEVSPEFTQRVRRSDVGYWSMRKAPGHALSLYPRLIRLFRELRPAIVHMRNLAALEVSAAAWAAGVPVRIHGEHGRDVGDLDGSSRKYQWVRRLYSPFVTQHVALSKDLERYLVERVGVRATKITQIYNGVDVVRFAPGQDGRAAIAGCPFVHPELFIVGTVGRMQEVKDPLNLVRAFALAVAGDAEARRRLRLVMVGDGPLRGEVARMLERAGIAELAWLPGERNDVHEVMCGFDCFVLPSLAEGISNTILEAMATALPVVATRVGGNAELIIEGETGSLVPAADPRSLAAAMLRYCGDRGRARAHGLAGRRLVERHFSLERMVEEYEALYAGLLARHGRARRNVAGQSRAPAGR